MNKEQQVPEDQQAAKAEMEHGKEQECVHKAQRNIEYLSDSSSSFSSDELSKHRQMTHLIQLQGKKQTNQ